MIEISCSVPTPVWSEKQEMMRKLNANEKQALSFRPTSPFLHAEDLTKIARSHIKLVKSAKFPVADCIGIVIVVL
jgi:hypothetical protein